MKLLNKVDKYIETKRINEEKSLNEDINQNLKDLGNINKAIQRNKKSLRFSKNGQRKLEDILNAFVTLEHSLRNVDNLRTSYYTELENLLNIYGMNDPKSNDIVDNEMFLRKRLLDALKSTNNSINYLSPILKELTILHELY